MASRAGLKASDAEREQVAERLRRATAEGRLLAEELEQRLEVAFSARTYGQLDELVADLPGQRLQHQGQRRVASWVAPAVALAFALPLLLAALAAVLFIVTGVLAAWGLWIVLAWWFFGYRRRYHPGPQRRRYYGGAPRRSAHAARPRAWL